MRSRTRASLVRACLYALCGVAGAAAYNLADTRVPPVLVVEALREPESWGVPVDPPSATPRVALHRGCRINQFGLHSWRKPGETTGQAWEAGTRAALALDGLPPGAVDIAIRRLRSGLRDDTVGFSNLDGVARQSARKYLPTFSNTYRSSKTGQRVLCQGSRTNFASDSRRVYAALYMVTYGGVTYHIGEVEDCGNVGRFTPAPPGWRSEPERADPQMWVIPAPMPRGEAGPHSRALQQINEVPEPGTWALIALGVLGLAATKRRK